MKIKATFQRMTGLWRTHFYVSEALQHGIEGRGSHCLAFLAMLLQSLHQTGIDNGDWTTSALLVPCEGPLNKPVFAASEYDLSDLFSYKKAVRELRTKAQERTKNGDEQAEEIEGVAPKGGGRGRPKK